MREGKTSDGIKVKQPSTTLSTAEAIGVAIDSALYAQYFGNKEVSAADVARNILGSVVKEDLDDAKILKEYAMLIAKRRSKDKHWNQFQSTMAKIIP